MALRIEGYVIVSADGMLADVRNVMPDELKFEGDKAFFTAALDRADLILHGRNSYEDQPNSPRRRRIILTRKVEKNGKGIILMHDFQKHTAEALPELLKKLKAGGYKVVAMRAKAPVETIAQYDEDIVKDLKLPTVSSRPVNSVVQTISE